MRIDILTLFPGMFQGPLTESILQRAQDEGKLQLQFHDLREWGIGQYRQIDDKPYGGGAGMVIRPDVLVKAIEAISHEPSAMSHQPKDNSPFRIYFSPTGKRLTQTMVERTAKKDWLLLVCGHYEGIDQRVIDGGWIDSVVSIGDYVLTGGELPAMVMVDAVARHLPGVLGDAQSHVEESFSKALDRKKEYPHYTRPEEFQNLRVPDVLFSGNHAKIEEWRREQLH